MEGGGREEREGGREREKERGREREVKGRVTLISRVVDHDLMATAISSGRGRKGREREESN